MNAQAITWRSCARMLLVHGMVWSVVVLLLGFAVFGEYERRSMSTTIWAQLEYAWRFSLVLQILGLGLSLVLRRWPVLLDSPRNIALTWSGMVLLMLPPELVYQAYLALAMSAKPLSWEALLLRLETEPKFLWMQCLVYESMVFAMVAGAALWRHSQWRRRAWEQAETENLRLRLDLEQQRMAALRGQLEPHFMFNALNAVSALVRSDDRKAALTALNRLSDLLRYALAAAHRDWSSIGEELDFVAAYLSLQGLRYGERLQVRIEGDSPAVRALECPPLVLQPLVENALRHDLDCHQEASDIRIRFDLSGGCLSVSLCNPQRPGLAPNPGLGLGLQHTRTRLQHAYGGQASLAAGPEDGRFCVRLLLPCGDAP